MGRLRGLSLCAVAVFVAVANAATTPRPALAGEGAPAPVPDRVTVVVPEAGYSASGDVPAPGLVTADSLLDGEPESVTGKATTTSPAGTLSMGLDVHRVLGAATVGTIRLTDPSARLDVSALPTGAPVRVADGVVSLAARGVAVQPGKLPRVVSATITVEDRHLDPGNHAVHFVLDGLARLAVVHVPPGLTGRAPALLELPGLIMTHWMFEFFGKSVAHSDAHGYLAVFAAHYGTEWVVKGDPRASYIHDETYIDTLVDSLIDRFDADPERIYTTGMSYGGFFTNQLACDRSGRIAAFAPVSGTLGASAACHPGRAVPIVMLHGTDDPLVPYGRPMLFSDRLDAPHTAAFWAAQNGCATTTEDTLLPDLDPDDGTRVVRHEWTACPPEAPVVLYEIQGGGHNWPGATPYLPPPILGGQTYDIVANDVVWDFVSRFDL